MVIYSCKYGREYESCNTCVYTDQASSWADINWTETRSRSITTQVQQKSIQYLFILTEQACSICLFGRKITPFKPPNNSHKMSWLSSCWLSSKHGKIKTFAKSYAIWRGPKIIAKTETDSYCPFGKPIKRQYSCNFVL